MIVIESIGFGRTGSFYLPFEVSKLVLSVLRMRL